MGYDGKFLFFNGWFWGTIIFGKAPIWRVKLWSFTSDLCRPFSDAIASAVWAHREPVVESGWIFSLRRHVEDTEMLEVCGGLLVWGEFSSWVRFLGKLLQACPGHDFSPPVSYGICFCRLQRFADGLSGPRPEYLFQIHLFPLCTGKIFDFPFQPKISMTSWYLWAEGRIPPKKAIQCPPQNVGVPRICLQAPDVGVNFFQNLLQKSWLVNQPAPNVPPKNKGFIRPY